MIANSSLPLELTDLDLLKARRNLRPRSKWTIPINLARTNTKIYLATKELISNRLELKPNCLSLLAVIDKNVFQYYILNERTFKVVRKCKYTYLGMNIIRTFHNQTTNALEIITDVAVYRLHLKNFYFEQVFVVGSLGIKEAIFCEKSKSYLIYHHGGVSEMNVHFKYKRKWCYTIHSFTKDHFPSIHFLKVYCERNWAIAWSPKEFYYLHPGSFNVKKYFHNSLSESSKETFMAESVLYLSKKGMVAAILTNTGDIPISNRKYLLRIYKVDSNFTVLYSYSTKESLQSLFYAPQRCTLAVRYGANEVFYVRIHTSSSKATFEETRSCLGRGVYYFDGNYLFCKRNANVNYLNISVLC